MFMKWGRVVDVFIPNKKNKEGKSFGFVRFTEVAYPMELEKRLDQLWIGSYKIRANCTRYHRLEEGRTVKSEPSKGDVVRTNQVWNLTRRSVSFADVVRGGKVKKVWQKKNDVREIWKGLDFNL